MRTRHIEQLDLNLLLALDALLVESNVTRAAVRARITQPAMSRALAKLRDAFRDPLLVRTGQGMRATPRAIELAPQLQRLLSDLESLFDEVAPFAPSTAERTFHVATVDYGLAVVLPPLLAALAQRAPGVRVVARDLGADLEASVTEGNVDVVLAPRRSGGAAMVWRPLFEERFVTLARENHPAIKGRKLSLATFCALDHVVVTPRGRGTSAVDEALAKVGRQRRIALSVPLFLVAPVAVAGTDLITTAPERIALRIGRPLGLVAYPAPVRIPGFTIHCGWHERMRADPGHTWFRGVLAEVTRAT